MATTLHENRPSAGIGVVEVQKPMVFCDFDSSRTTLCGDRRGRGAKTRGFLRFLKFPRDPLRGSAWSRCKNSRFFAISAVLAQPSAGIGVVEVKNSRFFAISAALAQPSAGIGVVEVLKREVFCDFSGSNWSSGVVSWFARLLPEPAGRGFDSSLVRGRASQDATCILKQLAQSNLRRASCAEQLAQSTLPGAVSRLLHECFVREKERILQRWADLACDVLLSGQPWSSFFLKKWKNNGLDFSKLETNRNTKKRPSNFLIFLIN